jgi:predicted  nucleic acid-binding Zn-ribbon protein
MQIDLTPEALLSQLGYTKSESSINQIEKTIENTKGFEEFSKHILALHDELAHLKAFVALSNSKDLFKIKCSEDVSKEIEDEFTTLVTNWADRYKINIEKVINKPTYYILGK